MVMCNNSQTPRISEISEKQKSHSYSSVLWKEIYSYGLTNKYAD